jgi:large subunit ribosomal protein L25
MQFEINAQARTLQGTGASRRLRRAGKVPGIIYGGEAAPQAIETDHNDLLLKLKKEAFHSSVINIVIDGKKEQVLLRDTQTHAYKPLVLHIDFQRVDATQELHIKVPLHFVNEETAPGVKLWRPGQPRHHRNRRPVPGQGPARVHRSRPRRPQRRRQHPRSQLKLPKGVKLVPARR